MFNATDSESGNSEILRYEWNFQDGTTKTGMISQHIYKSPGVYHTELTVFNTYGNSHSAIIAVTVKEPLIWTYTRILVLGCSLAVAYLIAYAIIKLMM
jgi:PKD repeat protein